MIRRLLIGLALAAAVRAWTRPRGRVLRISRVVADLDRAEAFYARGLGFQRVDAGPCEPWLAEVLGLTNAVLEQVVLRLGAQEIALVRCTPPGAAYPADSQSDDLWFQHFAVVADDMAAAYARLSAQSLVAISTDGPQALPARNGGVIAFKFRDPDGHPLELIQFPQGQGRKLWQTMGVGPFLGIDHTAIGVAATARSARFYRRLGFQVIARSLNHGPAQAALDGIPSSYVHVTGLRSDDGPTPGIELLAYDPPGRPAGSTSADAILTDWITIGMPGRRRRVARRDPDRHLLVFIPASEIP